MRGSRPRNRTRIRRGWAALIKVVVRPAHFQRTCYAATGPSHSSGAPIGPDKWTLALDFIGVECYGVLRFRRPVAGAMWPHGAHSPGLVCVFCRGPGARRNIAAIWPGEAAFWPVPAGRWSEDSD